MQSLVEKQRSLLENRENKNYPIKFNYLKTVKHGRDLKRIMY